MTTPLTKRQLEILEISTRIISHEGVQAFTMKQVAVEMGFSEPAIYKHFPNKVAILFALLDQFHENIESLASAHLAPQKKGGLVMFFTHVIETLAEKPALSAVIFSEEIFRSEPELASKVKGIMDMVEKYLVTYLQSQLRYLPKAPVEHIAWMFLGSVRLLVTRWRLADFSFDLKMNAQELLKTISSLTFSSKTKS